MTEPISWRDLLANGRGSIAAAADTPSQSDLRRAISTAYYAVFHALAARNANALAVSSPTLK